MVEADEPAWREKLVELRVEITAAARDEPHVSGVFGIGRVYIGAPPCSQPRGYVNGLAFSGRSGLGAAGGRESVVEVAPA